MNQVGKKLRNWNKSASLKMRMTVSIFLVSTLVFSAFAHGQEAQESNEQKPASEPASFEQCPSEKNPCLASGEILGNSGEADHKETKREGRRRRKKRQKQITYSLSLVSDIHPFLGTSKSTTTENYVADVEEDWWSYYFPKNSHGVYLGNTKWPLNDLIKDSQIISQDPDTQRSYFVEGLMQFSRFSRLSEDELASRVAEAMSDFSNTDTDKMALLTVFSERLYNNYNDKRNIFANKNSDPIAAGNISLGSIMTAAAQREVDQGGVCNDIAKAVATVGNKLFPDKDVLAISDGSHFGVLVHDKAKGNTIINWDLQTKAGGEPMLDPDIPVGNTRVFQVHDGKMVEIALLDTESGAIAKSMLNTQTPTLMTGSAPSEIFADFKREVGNQTQARTLEVKVGTAETSHSKMLIIVGETSKVTETSSSNTGLLIGHEKINVGPNENIIFAFHTGRQQNLIHLKGRNADLTASAGAELDAFGAVRLASDPTNEMNGVDPYSASLNLNQKIDFKNIPQNAKGPQFQFHVQAVEATGSKDEGNRESALSNPKPLDALVNSVHYTGFYLNQINGTGAAQIPLYPNVNSQTVVQYEGSNIGQKIGVTSGIELITSRGMRIYAFVGYLDDQKHGYLTKTSLFKDNSGGQAGVQLKLRNGTTISADAERLLNPNEPVFDVRTNIPVFKPIKKIDRKRIDDLAPSLDYSN